MTTMFEKVTKGGGEAMVQDAARNENMGVTGPERPRSKSRMTEND